MSCLHHVGGQILLGPYGPEHFATVLWERAEELPHNASGHLRHADHAAGLRNYLVHAHQRLDDNDLDRRVLDYLGPEMAWPKACTQIVWTCRTGGFSVVVSTVPTNRFGYGWTWVDAGTRISTQ